ncbi:MAG: LysE family translocator [Chromatiaceae bacterium]|nr:LysE family translocator [Chromatiaceae bacterium]
MNDLFPPWPLLATFIAASLLLAVTPGPGVLYIVTRSLLQGRRSGLASVAGVALGNLANAAGAALGLAALFAVSSAAFVIVKYAGAAYLIYLGIRALRTPPLRTTQPAARPVGARRVFRDGLFVALLNPKTTIFFAAFLPQFMSAGASPIVQGLTLGALFVAIAAITDSIYALAAGAIAPALMRARSVRSLGRYVTGGTFIGLGLFAAIAGPDRPPGA